MGRFLKRLFAQAAGERGFSLVLVLFVTAILMVISAEFAYNMRVESFSARNFKDEAKAYGLALAGLNMGIGEIAGKTDIVAIDSSGRTAFVKLIDGKLRAIAPEREFALGEGKVSYSIYDEAAKININTAERGKLDTLLKEAGVDEYTRSVVLDSVEDWKDANHEFRLNGAEDDYYESLPRPYEAKDSSFDTIEELLLVRGMTPEMFYGKGALKPGTAPNAYAGVYRHVTVKGDGRININTADESVLGAVYGKGRATEILLTRASEGFFNVPAYEGAVSSNIFLIESKGEVEGIRVVIRMRAEMDPRTSSVNISNWTEGASFPENY